MVGRGTSDKDPVDCSQEAQFLQLLAWRSSQRALNILLYFQEINNSIQFQYQKMIQDQALKQCRQILKKNNLHPLKKLGKGAFSFVFSVQKIQLKSPDNQVYSVKCINKKQFSKKPYLVKYIEQQIQSMRQVSHENIVKLIRTFEDQGWIFLIMEYCDKGNIYSAQSLRENGLFQLNQCLYITKSVLNGLNHIHSKNLIHRDIKAENILLISDVTKKQPFGYITKICDLGFCREDDDNVNTFCGTTSYMAPEIFKKNVYCNKVDVWAVGVLMYKMLFGDFPFKSINMEYEINSKCSKGFNLKKMKIKQNLSISKEKFQILAECFNKIFMIDPNDRIDISQLRKYPFFFQSEKKIHSIKNLPSTESDSGDDQSTFEIDKLQFVEQILQEVKRIKFLNNWQEISFQYYLKKIQLNLIQPFTKNNQQYSKKIKELEKVIANLQSNIDVNIKKINIPKFVDYYTPKTTSFVDYKQPYRLVVGYVFSKAHKSINDNTTLRSQVKIGLFCCHLINRIFEKQYRNQIFSHYFQWLKAQKRQKKFLFQSFKEWIKQQNPQKLVQTVQTMNDKFYRKK